MSNISGALQLPLQHRTETVGIAREGDDGIKKVPGTQPTSAYPITIPHASHPFPAYPLSSSARVFHILKLSLCSLISE